MIHHDFWLSASLASNFLLVLLSAASCLFLIRRLDRIVRARDMTEQRLIQLAFELRRLEQRVSGLEARCPETHAAPPPPAVDHAASLIAVPDLSSLRATDEDASGLAEKHEEVWAMVAAGRGLAEIVEATGRPIGQVELIAGLYRQHQRQRARTAGDHARTS